MTLHSLVLKLLNVVNTVVCKKFNVGRTCVFFWYISVGLWTIRYLALLLQRLVF